MGADDDGERWLRSGHLDCGDLPSASLAAAPSFRVTARRPPPFRLLRFPPCADTLGSVARLLNAIGSPGLRAASDEAAKRSKPTDRSRGTIAALASAVALALVWGVLGRSSLFIDSTFALVWGREVARGELPSYDAVALAPVPHPLATGFAALVSPLGESTAETAVFLLAFLSFGVVVWALFRIGELAFTWPAGMLAVIPVATSFTFLAATSAGAFDIAVAALLLSAVVLELRSSRCGTPVLILLTVAGLQRPEVWLLTGAYWLYLLPALDTAGRIRAGALASAAPAIWAAADLVATGDPLFSFTTTREISLVASDTVSPPDDAVTRVFDELRNVLRLPALVGGALGLALALAVAPRRSAAPAGLVIITVGASTALALTSVAVTDRYLLAAGAALAVFFGFFLVGWVRQRAGPVRLTWAAGAGLLVAGMVASVPSAASRIDRLQRDNKAERSVVDDLRSLSQRGRTARTLDGCPRVLAMNVRPVPYLSLWADRPLSSVLVPADPQEREAALIAPRSEAARRFMRGPGLQFRRVPAAFREVGGNRSWRLYTRGC